MPSALVSGVSRGLGAHLCRALKAAGHRVLGVGLAAAPRHDDVDDYRMVDLREPLPDDLFAGEDVDVLVNNAGVYLDDPRGGYGDLFALTVDDLRETFEVNVFGAARLVLRYAPRMLARGAGRIVCVSSGMGRLQDADGASFAYRSSKLAANSLTLSVARHFAAGAGDLAAFSYCPGWIRTDMGTPYAPDEPGPAADDLVRLLSLPAARSNGRFFRGLDELGWDTRGPFVSE
ncbi:SDR family NAD(P)-dependent oxidoreductase [Streptomyces sp. RerS4]|uniref:SDR family NAD(P)-dependent oxidoreductase n=1 Tax=Streptomyces sp. RerS4 TaxID=2942449 RepID=UPI00201C29E4|nr:SDR family NAD(P)-dependent oxidoreductase [Streptomyces sp. RerS4]UQX03569.1 SDR family NAD(P)-dependent oxidoreductase [Streptomyces sp. RerS4]